MNLAGKVAVVTGGAQGIGAAIVARLHRAGAAVASLDVAADRGNAAVGGLDAGSAPVTFLECDVTREDQVASSMAEAAARLRTEATDGVVDVLVNNAGRNAYADATEMTGEEWDAFFALDLKAAWLCAKYVLPGMREARRGSIVNIASIHSQVTIPGMFPYAAAKAGLIGLTRSLALDSGQYNIRVNAVCPGFIKTRVVSDWLQRVDDPAKVEADVLAAQPLGRMGTPDEVANLVAFLASDEASYISGAALTIDGALSARFPT